MAAPPDLEAIVNKLVADKTPKAEIDTVIRDYKKQHPLTPNEPTPAQAGTAAMRDATARAVANASGYIVPPRKQYDEAGNEVGSNGFVRSIVANPLWQQAAHPVPGASTDLSGQLHQIGNYGTQLLPLALPSGTLPLSNILPGKGAPLLNTLTKIGSHAGGAVVGGGVGYATAPQNSPVRQALQTAGGVIVGGLTPSLPAILEHIPGGIGEAMTPAIEKYRNWNSPFTATGRENRALLGSPFGDANAYRRDLYFRGINPEGPPAPSPAPTITPNPAGPTVFDEAAAQAKTEAATKDATDYARAQAHMDIGGPRPAAQAPTITRINPPPGPFEQVAAQAQDEKAAQDLAAYNRAQAHMDIGQPRMAGSHDVAPADITDTATDYYDVSKQNKQQKMAQQKAQQARQATVSQMATEPPAVTTPEITAADMRDAQGKKMDPAAAQRVLDRLRQQGAIPGGEIPFTQTTTLPATPEATMAPTSTGDPELVARNKQIGAEKVARQEGMSTEDMRKERGSLEGEEEGTARMRLPTKSVNNFVDAMREMPPGSPERQAYVDLGNSVKARTTGGVTMDALARARENLGQDLPGNVADAAKETGISLSAEDAAKYAAALLNKIKLAVPFAVPSALAARLSLLSGMGGSPDMPTPPPPPPGFSQ